MPGVRFLLACLKLCSKLPYRVQMRVGSIAGRFVYFFARKRRAVAARNIELCFPAATAAERRRLIGDHFKSLGRALFEAGLAYYAGEEQLRPLARIEGIENLTAALSHDRGVILVAAHITCMELCGRLLGLEIDYDAVYRPFSNPDVDAVVNTGRHRAVRRAIPKKSFKQFLRGLKDNRPILMTIDQATTASNKVIAPFFGVPAPTSVNAARIANKTGAAVLPVFWVREADLTGYRVKIGAALSDFPSNDPLIDAGRINALVEEQVNLAPEQYYWIHRRFKTDPSPYEE